jgi:pimeloyl-ACP methyl ester carboxylesterase
MANYVLVHGAWSGGYVWRKVAEALRAEGHLVFTPTLTGLADRSHLLTPQVDLDTHIRDIVNLMKWEKLVEDVVLVGHSYGGMVISGVAEEMPNGTIQSIVYLDAFYAPSGSSVSDCAPEFASQFFTTDPVPFPFQGQTGDPEFERLTTPQPLRSFTARPVLSGARDRVPGKTYVLATALPTPWFAALAARLKEDPTWRSREIACGHGTMREMPERTSAILLEAAQ